MPIKIIQGDLFSSNTDIIAHGVNCQGVMGSGVAKQIRERYPIVYTDYKYAYQLGKLTLGYVQLVGVGEKPRFIANCCTQQFYGKDGKKYACYVAIEQCTDNLLRFAQREGYSIAMPKIGAGLGGLDWSEVYKILQTLSSKYPRVAIEVYSYD